MQSFAEKAASNGLTCQENKPKWKKWKASDGTTTVKPRILTIIPIPVPSMNQRLITVN
jgi:hypothetical protein